MKKTLRLTESDLVKLVKRVIKEQGELNIEFDPTKKVPSEPKKVEPVNPQNNGDFEKIKSELTAIKKPSRVDKYEFNGKFHYSITYTDKSFPGKDVVVPPRTYEFAIDEQSGSVIIQTYTPEMFEIAKDAGFPVAKVTFNPKTRTDDAFFKLKWNEGDLNSNIQKMKTFLSNPKIKVTYY